MLLARPRVSGAYQEERARATRPTDLHRPIAYLRIAVVQARGLRTNKRLYTLFGSARTSNPFVEIEYDTRRDGFKPKLFGRTRVVRGSVNPVRSRGRGARGRG